MAAGKIYSICLFSAVIFRTSLGRNVVEAEVTENRANSEEKTSESDFQLNFIFDDLSVDSSFLRNKARKLTSDEIYEENLARCGGRVMCAISIMAMDDNTPLGYFATLADKLDAYAFHTANGGAGINLTDEYEELENTVKALLSKPGLEIPVIDKIFGCLKITNIDSSSITNDIAELLLITTNMYISSYLKNSLSQSDVLNLLTRVNEFLQDSFLFIFSEENGVNYNIPIDPLKDLQISMNFTPYAHRDKNCLCNVCGLEFVMLEFLYKLSNTCYAYTHTTIKESIKGQLTEPCVDKSTVIMLDHSSQDKWKCFNSEISKPCNPILNSDGDIEIASIVDGMYLLDGCGSERAINLPSLTCENCKEFCECQLPDKCSACTSDIGFQYDSILKECFKTQCEIQNCLLCRNNTACEKCKENYILNSSKQICGCSNITNCSVCQDNGINCEQCANSYILDSTKEFCGCNDISSCSVCNRNNTCSQCATNFVLSSDKSFCGCSSISNCSLCNKDDNLCGECTKNFVLSSDRSFCGCSHIGNCRLCNKDDNSCSECDSNYVSSSNKAFCGCSAISNCSVCNFNNTCNECKSNFVISADKNFCGCSQISNCRFCNKNNTCADCATNFVLSTDKSFCGCDNIGNCSVCSNNNSCSECSFNHVLSADKGFCGCRDISNCIVCNKNNTCNECANNFIMSADKRFCGCSHISNCSVCNNDNTCSECVANSVLSADKQFCGCSHISSCSICNKNNTCSQCKTAYSLSSDKNFCGCSDISHCGLCNKNDTCNQCMSTFVLSSDNRFCGCDTIEDCMICNKNNSCAKCRSSILSIDAKCGCSTLTNCLLCDTDLKSCILCAETFVVDQGICQQGWRYYNSSYLKSFEFDAYYSKIVMSLNTESAVANDPSCSSYFLDISTLGFPPTCSKIDNFTIEILLGPGWKILPNQTLTCSKNFLMKNTAYLYKSDFTVGKLITPASTSTTIEAIIEGPALVTGACGVTDVTYSARSSRGVGSSRFEYKWTLDDREIGTSQTITIRDLKILKSQSKLLLFVSNPLFKTSSSALLDIRYNDLQSISFKINAENAVYSISSEILLYPININYCRYKGKASYKWTVNQENHPANTPALTIEPGKLSPGKNEISLTIELTHKNLRVSATSKVNITIKSQLQQTSTNRVPHCTGDIEVNPAIGTPLKTLFSFGISGCYDQDYFTLSLEYRLYFNKGNNSIPVAVGLNHRFDMLILTKDVRTIDLEVCDQQGGCFNKTTAAPKLSDDTKLEL